MTKELKPLLVDVCGKVRLLRPHRLYDNALDNRTADRYTLIFMDDPGPAGDNTFGAFGFDEDPTHPQGIGMHCVAMPGRHLGRRIGLKDLPDRARQVAVMGLEIPVLYDGLQRVPL